MPALDEAIARIERRFGSHALARGQASERRTGERRLSTGTSFDRIAALTTGSACLLVGEGTSGKLALAYRAAAAAQRDGGYALWLDAPGSLDPLVAERAGVTLERLVVVRARTRTDAVVACGAALRSDGFRAVVLDCGAPPRIALSADDAAPLLPLVRASTSALIVVAEQPGSRIALPAYRFACVAWERRHGRTVGWTFAVSRAGSAERALFHASASGQPLIDVGLGGEHREAVG